MKVRKFSYNGFMGKVKKGFAPYTVTFIAWTNDPGIGRFACSDGKERLIPSFAVDGELPPEPDYNAMKDAGTFQYFGPACES